MKIFSGNVLNVLFTGVESAQGFLVIVVVFSVIAVTNGFIKNVHFLKITNLQIWASAKNPGSA